MLRTLDALRDDTPRDDILDFKSLRERIGFDDYYDVSNQYDSSQRDGTR